MDSHNPNKQRGAVLAFSLVMLLLLTITGTRMIQQNKMQLQIVGNARLSAQEFANAESLLVAAKKSIQNNYATQCVNTTTATAISGVTNALILSVSGALGNTCQITIQVTSEGKWSAARKIKNTYFVNTNTQISWKEIVE